MEDDASVKDGTDGDSEKAMLEGREGEAGHSAGTEGGSGIIGWDRKRFGRNRL